MAGSAKWVKTCRAARLSFVFIAESRHEDGGVHGCAAHASSRRENDRVACRCGWGAWAGEPPTLRGADPW